MKIYKTIMLILMIAMLLSFCVQQKKIYPIKEIQVAPLLNLVDLYPKIELAVVGNNPFCVDAEENIYFLDRENHRILKFSKDGTFRLQIGRLGQGKGELYSPMGIFIRDDFLFVLNRSGKNALIFSLTGDFISRFDIENAKLAHSLFIVDEIIFVDVKYRDLDSYNENKLISVFNIEGKNLKCLGEIVKCLNYYKYLSFNNTFLSGANKKIFGCFKYYPYFFAYDFDGKEILYKDLRNLGLKEIQEKLDQAKKIGADTPNSLNEAETYIKSIIYCVGFGVAGEDIYYALNDYSSKPAKGILLHFDGSGNLLERIFFKKRDETYAIVAIFIYSENKRYVVGRINETVTLFKF